MKPKFRASGELATGRTSCAKPAWGRDLNPPLGFKPHCRNWWAIAKVIPELPGHAWHGLGFPIFNRPPFSISTRHAPEFHPSYWDPSPRLWRIRFRHLGCLEAVRQVLVLPAAQDTRTQVQEFHMGKYTGCAQSRGYWDGLGGLVCRIWTRLRLQGFF